MHISVEAVVPFIIPLRIELRLVEPAKLHSLVNRPKAIEETYSVLSEKLCQTLCPVPQARN